MLQHRIAPAEKDESPTKQSRPNISQENLFTALSSERRRNTIEALTEIGEPTSLSKIVDYVAESELDKPIAEINSDERNRIYVSLYQCHVPHLADTNLLNYNEDTKQISASPQTEFARTFIQVANPLETPTEATEDKIEEGTSHNWIPYLIGATASAGIVFLLSAFFDQLSSIINTNIALLVVLIGAIYITVSLEFGEKHSKTT